MKIVNDATEKDTKMDVGRHFEAERQRDLLKVKCVRVEDGLETVRGIGADV